MKKQVRHREIASEVDISLCGMPAPDGSGAIENGIVESGGGGICSIAGRA